ncbi:AAA family ATPase [uncultured Agitococcus sp.]|uniref:AAA family ATPase n=1 Tax=uncultured Agitococcus sp. TaxID=1506599 RepID=UPI00260A3699|nr:AAA family ATPase [uncultured Agitococcus sp.]
MKIKCLTLTHFRRFTNFEMDFHPQLTVLVARNGAGKSSILDAIATALGVFLTRLPKVVGLNPKETDFQVYANGQKPPYMRISCESTNGIKWDRTVKRDQTPKTAKEIPEALGVKALNDYVDQFIDAHNANQPYELPVFIHYGTGRAVFDVPTRKSGFGKDYQRFDALRVALESRANFRSFVEYFYALEDIEAKKQKEARSFDVEIPELKAIRRAIQKMLPDFSNPRGAEVGIQIDWTQGNQTTQLRIEQLSDGYRTTLAMVMDIAARMAEANPDMPDPLQTEGVVLIDEIDLHLHPGWQQTILLDLMRTFPNIQFIVSTHSPQVVSSVKPECLRVIDWHNEHPRLLPVLFSEGAEAQQVLLDVLGVKSPRVEKLEIVQTLKAYQTLVDNNQWDSEEALKLRQTLDQWGAGFEPELVRLDVDIRLQSLDR